MIAEVLQSMRKGDKSLADHWWLFVLRGVFAMGFGAITLAWPGLTLSVLLGIFAAFCLLDGIASLLVAARARRWGWALVAGLSGTSLGALTLIEPAVAAIVLVLLIGSFSVVRGLFDLAAAFALRDEIRYEWAVGLSGLVSVAFGLYLLLRPQAGALALAGLIAAFAIAFGMLLLIGGVRLRRMRAGPRHRPPVQASLDER